ncbi:hypothetical protein JW992_06675 [candidate division KSB1 bacterium]|nr:hypothetical protein [candidate division KSB1 bacterium]
MDFQPDYRHVLAVLENRRPQRLPIYEHLISPSIMAAILRTDFAGLIDGDESDQSEFFRHYCRFFREMTYDTVSFEVCITEILPDHGAIMGGRPGPIQDRQDFERYPWDELPERFWSHAEPQFCRLKENLPPGMKAVGGIGNGVFEISEDLVGYEYLAYLGVEDPELFADLYRKIGDLMETLWTQFLARHLDAFAICRFGDDLGFKTSTLMSPQALRLHVLPQYKRVIDRVHKAERPFLLHSCGHIFSIMEDAIAAGIDAKHSNEDAVAPFERWIDMYGDRIGLFGGIDLDLLCVEKPETVYERVVDLGSHFRARAQGYALGSGNSIPDYVPLEGYLALISAAQKIRADEQNS